MNNTIRIDTFGKKLDQTLNIKSEYFGEVVFYYKIVNVKTNRFLRYRIGDHTEIFMVEYDIIEENITLHEYFRNTLKYLNIQLAELEKNSELRNDFNDNESALISYVEQLKKNYLEKNT